MKIEFIKIEFIYKDKILAWLSLALFCITFYILYVLKPNQVNYEEQKISYFFTCFIQSITPFLLFIFSALITSRRIKKRELEWNIGYEFLFIFILIIGVGICNYLTRDLVYINEQNWSSHYLFEELVNSFSVGAIVAFVIVLFRIIIELYLNLQKAKSILNKIPPNQSDRKSSQNNLIQIQGANKSQNFTINTTKFLYAKSAGNYVDIFLENEETPTRLTKRISLYTLLNQVGQGGNIIRIHKSYLVNLHKVINVKGNAAGLFLTLAFVKEINIPVSRKYLPVFEKGIKKNNV